MEKKNYRIGKKVLFIIFMMWMMAGLAACSGKGAVVLEADDLVRLEEKAAAPDPGTGSEAVLTEEPGTVSEAPTLFVHICGEVMLPGVYELPEGSRIYEAVEKAGGFTEEAAADYVNLAYVLEDGWRIEIPSEEGLAEGNGRAAEDGSRTHSGQAGISAGATAGAEAVFPGGTPGQRDSMPDKGDDGLVDLNTATKQELVTLPGVGESRAESIISYREKNGGFSRIEDIMKVEGIKEGMFAKMKDRICVRGVK